MAPVRSLLIAALLSATAQAHFELIQPTSLEGDSFNENLEANAPCGGGVADLSKNTATDFHVDGDAVGLLLGHAQANWLIRATLDERAGGNWTQLFPIVTQSGRGNFCEPSVTAPKEWVGKKGIIGIACAAPDGLLFQCAAVNFVEGANKAPSNCQNGSSVSLSFTSDPTLSALVGDASSSTAPSPSSSSSGAPSASTSPS
ncbi:hypothetical protein N657DRAFT_545880, partial [Parathielavia appendiculata]